MKHGKSALLALTSAFALALVPAAYGADEGKDKPGFNELDKNDDGSLSKSEAAGNPILASHFSKVDGDSDGKVTRVEYLKTMASKDFRDLRENASNVIDPDDKGSATGSSGSSSK